MHNSWFSCVISVRILFTLAIQIFVVFVNLTFLIFSAISHIHTFSISPLISFSNFPSSIVSKGIVLSLLISSFFQGQLPTLLHFSSVLTHRVVVPVFRQLFCVHFFIPLSFFSLSFDQRSINLLWFAKMLAVILGNIFRFCSLQILQIPLTVIIFKFRDMSIIVASHNFLVLLNGLLISFSASIHCSLKLI